MIFSNNTEYSNQPSLVSSRLDQINCILYGTAVKDTAYIQLVEGYRAPWFGARRRLEALAEAVGFNRRKCPDISSNITTQGQRQDEGKLTQYSIPPNVQSLLTAYQCI